MMPRSNPFSFCGEAATAQKGRARNARPVCGIAPRIREWAQKIPAASGCGEDMHETEKPGRSAQIL